MDLGGFTALQGKHVENYSPLTMSMYRVQRANFCYNSLLTGGVLYISTLQNDHFWTKIKPSKMGFLTNGSERLKLRASKMASLGSSGHAWGALLPPVSAICDNWSKNGLKKTIFGHFRPFLRFFQFSSHSTGSENGSTHPN